MVELSLILSIALLAATFALLLARWSLAQAQGTAEASRVLGAVRRAGDDFAWKQSKRSLLVGLAVGGALVAARPLLGTETETPAQLQWTIVAGVVVGALLSMAAGQLAVHLGPRAADRVSTAMRRATHTHAVSVALRSAAAIGLATEALSLFAVGGALLFHSIGAEHPFERHSGPLLGGIALGAALSALLGQCSGGAMQSAGLAGRRQRAFDTGRERFDLNAQNPTLVLDLMGNHVGVTAPRTLDAFCASCLAHCATIALVETVARSQAINVSPVALLCLPVLVRAFGVLAGTISLLSTRADESDDVGDVLWRGQLALAVMATASLAGLCYWVFGDGWLPWFAATALGLAASLVVVFSRQQLADRRTTACKSLRETATLSSSLATSEAIGASLRAAWLPLLALALAAGSASLLGQEAVPTNGARLALALLVAGFCMSLPYLQALTLLDPIVDGGCSMASLDEPKRPELHHRATRLNQTALSSGSAGQGYFVAVTGLLGIPATLYTSTRLVQAATPNALEMLEGLDLLGGLVGLAVVLSLAGFCVVHGARAAKQAVLDLTRQVRAFTSDEKAAPSIPADFRPRYAEALGQAGQRALALGSYAPLGAIVAPVLVVTLSRLSAAPAGDATRLLTSLLAFASISGICLALIACGGWSLLSSARRHTRSTNETQTKDLRVADNNADFLGNALCPSIALVTKGVLAAGLALALVVF